MNDIAAEIVRIEAENARLETVLTDLEAEVLDLQRELAGFKKQYDSVVKPVSDRLEAVRGAIAELEQRRVADALGDARPLESTWTPPPDYVPVEEQFRRAWRVTPDEAEAPTIVHRTSQSFTLDDREVALKRLYRQLARRYHPDLTADPAERDYRNALMARINEAYAARDYDALKALSDQPDRVSTDKPLASLRLHDLRQVNAQLHRRLTRLDFERAELLHSDLMALKIEERLVRSRGRDLLREMAAQMEQEYAACMVRLEQLRRR